MNVWQLQSKISRRLLQWAGFSMLSGGIMWLFGGPFWRGVGIEFASWGFIDGLIALFGQASADRRLDTYENPGAPDVLEKEGRNLKRILLINAGLDVLYILGGRWLRDRGGTSRKGHGQGIILQGLFLLCFDLIHALLIRDNGGD